MFKKQLFLVVLVVVAAGQSARAATITVRKDGTGDYTQVQPALDAAASGDTILIGPGEFTELVPSYIPGYAWDVEVCAYVRVPDLTIIGAGAGQTILGPTTYLGNTQTFSPKCMVWLEGSARRVSGITFRNCYEGIHATNGPMYIDECEFLDNGGYGIIWGTNSNGGWIKDTRFSSSVVDDIGLRTFWAGSSILVENCVFDTSNAYIEHTQGITFLNCEVMNVKGGIEFHSGATGVISGCTIQDCSVVGVGFVSAGLGSEITDSIISSDGAAVGSLYGGTVSVTSSVLTGGTLGALYFIQSGPFEVHGSHLFRQGEYTVNCSQLEAHGLVVHDLTGNYWGSTDPEMIASWILDQNDDQANFSIVNFLPLADGPVSVETKSWGSVKALFR